MADALSCHPHNPESSSDSDDDDEWETISCGLVCHIINHHTDSVKIPHNIRYKVQNNEMETEQINETIFGTNFNTSLLEA